MSRSRHAPERAHRRADRSVGVCDRGREPVACSTSRSAGRTRLCDPQALVQLAWLRWAQTGRVARDGVFVGTRNGRPQRSAQSTGSPPRSQLRHTRCRFTAHVRLVRHVAPQRAWGRPCRRPDRWRLAAPRSRHTRRRPPLGLFERTILASWRMCLCRPEARVTGRPTGLAGDTDGPTRALGHHRLDASTLDVELVTLSSRVLPWRP
jgi:hypothetical protein